MESTGISVTFKSLQLRQSHRKNHQY